MSTISAGTTSTTTLVHSGDTTGSLVFKTNDTGSGGTTAVTIDTSQNVGIGITPSTKLDVSGTSRYTFNVANAYTLQTSINAAGSAFVDDYKNALSHIWQTSGSERMRIDSSGNVGIGTSSPTSSSGGTVLNVASSTIANFVGTVTSVSNGTIWEGRRTGRSASARFGQINLNVDASDNGWMQFNTATAGSDVSERMRIDSSGNLLVGQTSQTGSEKIGVTQSGATSATAYFYATAGNYSNAVITSRCARGSATTEYNFLECNQVSTLQLVIRANGNVVNTNNSYGAISDIKLKENITDATPKLADLMQVKVRNYNLKTEPDHKQLGVIAQELEQVFPSMIEEAPDKDEEGNDLGTTTKSVKYSVFIPMLIKSIQELKAINDQQAETINALTARVVALESK